MITQNRIKELLIYNPTTGNFTRRNNGGIAGSDSSVYSNIYLDGTMYQSHRVAWLYVYGYWPENDIDHINRDKHDNRISNLREVSRQCNARNTGNRSSNNSGVKGVSFCNTHRKWAVYIRTNKGRANMGLFSDFDEAVCVRLAAEQFEDYDNCDTTSPAYLYVKERITVAV